MPPKAHKPKIAPPNHIAKLEKMLQECELELQRFQERFTACPMDAFTWADSAIKAAARVSAISTLKAALEGGLTEDKKIAWIQDRLLQASRAGHSTSPSTNVTNNALVIAWGDILETIRWAD